MKKIEADIFLLAWKATEFTKNILIIVADVHSLLHEIKKKLETMIQLTRNALNVGKTFRY